MNKPFNITDPDFKANPFPFYARLRAEAPVYRITMPDKQPAWLITRYDDVMMVLKDDQQFVKNPRNAKTPQQLAKMPWIPPMFRALMFNMLWTDWDDHRRLRGLVHKAFTPQMIEQMRGRVQALSDELLDAAQRRGHMDVIGDYAMPIPMTVISEMLGIARSDQARFNKWTNGIVELGAKHNIIKGLPHILGVTRFLRSEFKKRRAHPTDDLLTALVQAEEAGEQLNEDELLATAFVLLVAGYETTMNLIGSGTLALLQHPDQLRLLRERPELIKNAVEELLRYVNPVEQATERYAREDVTLHGVTIPKGELVIAVVASANRDESVFPNGDILDITRENLKHLDFGQGVHYCIGAPLARLEGQIAINTLTQRLPSLKLNAAPESLRWRQAITLRGLEALPVTV
jgi:cytochrome P450